MLRLFIAEKPSVARAIAAAVGASRKGEGFLASDTDIVTWCFGHMLELADPAKYLPDESAEVWKDEDLPILPGEKNAATGHCARPWTWETKKESAKQLKIIEALLREKRYVPVNAGDPDNEGQLLVDEVMEWCGRKPYDKEVLRYWASAQDPSSVKKGVSSLKPNSNFKGMADAARSRQQADWLIGMNLSRALTLANRRNGGDALVAVGRVQTPTLSLIVLRDREIENFRSKEFFKVEALCTFSNTPVIAAWMPDPTKTDLDPEGRVLKKDIAEDLVRRIQGKEGKVVKAERKAVKKTPPKCFSLADLTALASSRWGYTAQAVLDGCQALYESKLTTYPRTDCPYLPEDQHAEATQVLAAVAHNLPTLSALGSKANPSLKSHTWDDKKITAHHAIIPTGFKASIDGLSPTEKNLYEAVCRQYLAQFMPALEYDASALLIEIESEQFAANGRKIRVPGWTTVLGNAEGKDASEQDLPDLHEGDACTCRAAKIVSAMTKPPAAFSEGTLIKAMENIAGFMDLFEKNPQQLALLKKTLREGDGIGTSATRAEIITRLKDKKYIEAKGKKIVSTLLGRAVCGSVPPLVRSPGLTALFERMLKEVAEGSRDASAFYASQRRFVIDEVEKARQNRTIRIGSAARRIERTWGVR
jgi:DNA topoisomerase-3